MRDGNGGLGGAVERAPLEEAGGPSDVDAERAVLAAILLDAGCELGVVWRARARLKPPDFTHPAHPSIFEAMVAVVARGRALDILTLTAELRDRGCLNACGGAQYLGELTDFIPTLAHADAHIGLVADAARGRRTMQAARTCAQRAARGERPEALLGLARAVMDAASADAAADLAPLDDAIDLEAGRMIAEEKKNVASTGLATLDRALAGGLWDGQLIILGARPSVGKSALALLMAWAVAADSAAGAGGVVIFISLEMPRRDLAARLACLVLATSPEGPVDLMQVRERKLSDIDSVRYSMALGNLRGLPLQICDRRGLTPSHVRAMALTARARHGRVALVVVDYLQKMAPDTPRENREREVSEASGALANLAGELGCPVLALSQLNRKAAERKPTMADLRESGAVEQDADVILLLHREDNARAKPVCLVEKQRNGVAPEEVPLGWVAAGARFVDRADTGPVFTRRAPAPPDKNHQEPDAGDDRPEYIE